MSSSPSRPDFDRHSAVLETVTTSERIGWWIVGRVLNVAYLGLLFVVAPVLIVRSLRQGKYRSGWAQKLWGAVPHWPVTTTTDNQRQARYWFHAVSVGEVLLLQSVIAELRRREPQSEIILSTTTATGQKVAREKFPDCRHCYFPLDFTWAVKRAIRRLQPTRIIMVELELWPNFISAARLAGVPIALINGRLGERSFRGYARLNRFGSLIGRVLRCFDVIAVQTETYAARFQALGADTRLRFHRDQKSAGCRDGVAMESQPTDCRLKVTGSVKYDRVQTDRANSRTTALRLALGIQPDDQVFVAGSTQDPEEAIALRVWSQLCVEFPKLRLILVPRHKERFDEVARHVTDCGYSLLRRSQSSPLACDSIATDHPQSEVAWASSPCMTATVEKCTDWKSMLRPVVLLDTLGELADCWGLADFAFVGGSLTRRGGQNMIEPAGFGAAVCFGPDTRNFRDVVENLLERSAAVVVTDETALLETLRTWLRDPAAAAAMGRRAQAFVTTQSGASARTVDLICDQPRTVVRRAA